MDVLGIILVMVGLILMVASGGIYRNGLKSARKMTDSPKEAEEYMMLVGNGMVTIRIIGFILMLMGGGIFLIGLMIQS